MSVKVKSTDGKSTAVLESIYDRIGGAPALQAAVDAFYVRVLADPALKPFFEKTNLAALKTRQRAFFGQALGGPEVYRGRDMRSAHARFQITQNHFDKVAGHLVDTLTSLGVDQETVGEIVAAVAPLAAEIVNTKESKEQNMAQAESKV